MLQIIINVSNIFSNKILSIFFHKINENGNNKNGILKRINNHQSVKSLLLIIEKKGSRKNKQKIKIGFLNLLKEISFMLQIKGIINNKAIPTLTTTRESTIPTNTTASENKNKSDSFLLMKFLICLQLLFKFCNK